MLSLLTRVGRNCTLVITGDLAQSDLNERNGLRDFLDKYASSKRRNSGSCEFEGIVHVELTHEDIKRSDLVKRILRIYSEENWCYASNSRNHNHARLDLRTYVRASKMVLLGDTDQSDLEGHNGLESCIVKYKA